MSYYPYFKFAPKPLKSHDERADFVEYILNVAREHRNSRPAKHFTVVFTGGQGSGKSTLLSVLALNFENEMCGGEPCNIYYDITFPRYVGYDYVFLDDFAATLHATEHMTKEGRTVRKMEILIREIARYGAFYAAPRESDIMKQIRVATRRVHLYTRSELKEYGINTNCDIVAYYLRPKILIGEGETVKKFCIYIEDLKRWGYLSPRWQYKYTSVQSQKKYYIEKYLKEFTV